MTEKFQISLAAARVNACFSQQEVCDALKISKNTICNWEKGHTVPNIEQARELSKLYNMPLEFIRISRRNG